MPAYEWKTKGLYNVEAESAAKELERIEKKHGELNPSLVVEESKDENAVLHSCFEWNDEVAASRYREQQARVLICNVAVTYDEKQEAPVRAFVHVEKTYQPIDRVLSNKDMTKSLLDDAMRELDSFKRKYSTLEKLAPVFKAIEEVQNE